MNSYYAIVYIPWSFKVRFVDWFSSSLCLVTFRIPSPFLSISVFPISCSIRFLFVLRSASMASSFPITSRGQSLAMASKTAGTVAATILSLILMLVVSVPFTYS